MTQYYQIRPTPEHYVPTEQWGTYGVITENTPLNHDYVSFKIDDWRHVTIRKECLVPVFEAGLVAQLDRLFGYDKDQGNSAHRRPKPSPQPLNESADAPVEPTVYDDVNKRMEALERRVKILETGPTSWVGTTVTFPYPLTSGVTVTPGNFQVLSATTLIKQG